MYDAQLGASAGRQARQRWAGPTVSGSGLWNGQPNFRFTAAAFDDPPGGPDGYGITISDLLTGEIAYNVGGDARGGGTAIQANVF